MCVDSPFVDRVMKEPCNRILYILYTHTFRSGPRFVRCVHQTWNTFRVVCALLAKYCRSGRRLPPFQLFSYRFSIQYTIRSFQSSPRFHFDLKFECHLLRLDLFSSKLNAVGTASEDFTVSALLIPPSFSRSRCNTSNAQKDKKKKSLIFEQFAFY